MAKQLVKDHVEDLMRLINEEGSSIDPDAVELIKGAAVRLMMTD